jgi:hypothetical protein
VGGAGYILLWLRHGAPLKDIEEKIKQAFGAR